MPFEHDIGPSANGGGNSISVLLGKGDGTFQPRVDDAVGSYAYSIAVGDLNADGQLDLAVSEASVPKSLYCSGKGMERFKIPSTTAQALRMVQ